MTDNQELLPNRFGDFIELTVAIDNVPFLLRINSIESVFKDPLFNFEKYTCIHTFNSRKHDNIPYRVKESYESIKKILSEVADENA